MNIVCAILILQSIATAVSAPVARVPEARPVMPQPKKIAITDCSSWTNVNFRWDSAELDRSYLDNGAQLSKFEALVDSLGAGRIKAIEIVSQSSPEGRYQHNLDLSSRRASTMRSYVKGVNPSLSSKLSVSPDGESWRQLREYVEADVMIPDAIRPRILKAIAIPDVNARKDAMKSLGDDPALGDIYNYLLQTWYPLIRNSAIYLVDGGISDDMYASADTPSRPVPTPKAAADGGKPGAPAKAKTDDKAGAKSSASTVVIGNSLHDKAPQENKPSTAAKAVRENEVIRQARAAKETAPAQPAPVAAGKAPSDSARSVKSVYVESVYVPTATEGDVKAMPMVIDTGDVMPPEIKETGSTDGATGVSGLLRNLFRRRK